MHGTCAEREPPLTLPRQHYTAAALARAKREANAIERELYGDELTLRERIERLKATNPHGVDDLFELANKYLV
jgi:hypothetical protein